MGRAIDLFVTYRFLKLLTTPFEKTDAYKLGIIDEKGNRIMPPPKGGVRQTKPATLGTTAEKNAYTILHKLVFNIKKIFAKVPGLRTKVGTYAAALFLLKDTFKESVNDPDMFEKEFMKYLKENNIECIVTREPGGTTFGESVRDILLDTNSSLDSVSEAVLFYASRVYNYNSIILKALNDGKYVICDRFHYSTLVYQGITQNNEDVINLHNVLDPYFSKNISLIFHLDASIETCCSRINKRAASDKFEKQGRELLLSLIHI
mgnify:CR=1 FL=1